MHRERMELSRYDFPLLAKSARRGNDSAAERVHIPLGLILHRVIFQNSDLLRHDTRRQLYDATGDQCAFDVSPEVGFAAHFPAPSLHKHVDTSSKTCSFIRLPAEGRKDRQPR